MVDNAQFDLSVEMGPMFTINVAHSMATGSSNVSPPFQINVSEPIEQTFTLVAGVKSSSLFSGGAESPTNNVSVIAAQPLGVYRAVEITGIYCEPNISSLSRYAGVTRFAVTTGEKASVARAGLITDGGWNWTPDVPIFVGASGVLTQVSLTVPVRRIGWAVSPTQINLDPFPTIGA